MHVWFNIFKDVKGGLENKLVLKEEKGYSGKVYYYIILSRNKGKMLFTDYQHQSVTVCYLTGHT